MSYITGALTLLIKLPYLIPKYLITHKVVLIILIVAIGAFVALHQFSSSNQSPQQAKVTAYQAIAPSKVVAPKVGQTESRVYYIKAFNETLLGYVLTDWFDYNQKQWVEHKTPLPFAKDDIKIFDR